MKRLLVTDDNSFRLHLLAVLPEQSWRVLPSWHAYQAHAPDSQHILLVHRAQLASIGPEQLKQAHARGARIGIADDNPEPVQALTWLATGISAYFNSHMGRSHFTQMLDALSHGQAWFPPEVMSAIVRTAVKGLASQQPGSPGPEISCLTAREHEIARAVADGLRNKLIAQKLEITERTVKAHLTRIFQKTDTSDRLALALLIKQQQKT